MGWIFNASLQVNANVWDADSILIHDPTAYDDVVG